MILANALRRLRYRVVHEDFFDTICVEVGRLGPAPPARCGPGAEHQSSPALRRPGLCVALDETVTLGDVADLISIFSLNEALPFMLDDIGVNERAIPQALVSKRRRICQA